MVGLAACLWRVSAHLGGPDTWINRRILSNQAAVFVGLISYPLYLWHWPSCRSSASFGVVNRLVA